MSVSVKMIEHPTQTGLDVESVEVTDADTLREVRESDWVEGQMSLLVYKSSVVGYVGGEPPRFLSGHRVTVGDTILKGPAGDFEVLAGAA